MTTTNNMMTAMELLDTAILDLQCRLMGSKANPQKKKKGNDKQEEANASKSTKSPTSLDDNNNLVVVDDDLPDILKLQFKVGQITKVWNHPEADKLYCEEIDVGEETVRPIASGLRQHFTLEQMQGQQRLLVVANIKAKNLVKFKSHGMVLCAANEETGQVEFVEPPAGAAIGEVVTFEGLPPPQPLAPAQVEKKKVFAKCMEGMKTTEDKVAVWNGHKFMTSAGPCTVKSIQGGVLR
jgi:aminoacyl tRNA synthase complex-interacting multifunctional protein 1